MSIRYSRLAIIGNDRTMRVFLFVLISLSAKFVLADKLDLKIDVAKHDYAVEKVEIEKEVYHQASKIAEPYLDMVPLNEEQLKIKFPDIFKRKYFCYLFPISKAAKRRNLPAEIKVCRNRGKGKISTDYKFIGQYGNHVLIKIWGYEWRGFVSVNLSNGQAFSTKGKPFTSNSITAISHSYDAYTDNGTSIQINGLGSDMVYHTNFSDWSMLETIFSKGAYYIKLEKTIPRYIRPIRYLKFTIKDKQSSDKSTI